MATKVIREWLAEFKVLPENEINTYANTIRANDDLIDGLYDLFAGELVQEVVDPVCHQLFEFYRTGRKELQRFTLELMPTLIEVYLVHISKNSKRKCGGIEVCFLGIYNLEIVNKDGSSRVQSFTIPTLAHPSIYHESFLFPTTRPPSLATLALTESALMRYHSDEPCVIGSGPMPQYESINAQNRFQVLSHILSLYNSDIVNLSVLSRQRLCKMAGRVAKAGFDSLERLTPNKLQLNEFKPPLPSSASVPTQRRSVKFTTEPRITLNSTFLVELLNSVYFSMFNGHAKEAILALEDIHRRASYELLCDVLLVTNGIRNSLTNNPSGQPGDGPIGISVALSPTASNPSFSKSAITNASFRAKKLPEDIECPEQEDEASQPPNYEEVVEGEKVKVEDKMKAMGTKMAKPLKSIMKKAEKGRTSRRESDVKKRDGTDGSSPRHSMVLPVSSSSVSENGDIADPSMVNVSVVRSGSRTVVDQMELTREVNHKRTASYTEPSYSFAEENEDAVVKPLLHSSSQSRELRAAMNGGNNSSGSSNGSLNTQL